MVNIISREANNLAPPRSVQRVSLSHWQGITLHHTAGPANQSLRQIQQAAFSQGLVDTHYSFFIRDGVHMGRGLYARPAGDRVNVNVQVCFPGNWSNSLPPSRDLDTLVELIGWLDSEIGRSVSDTIVGHRDVPGNATACPGDRLARWMRDELPGRLAAGAGGVHTVAPGDTLSAIARQHGTSVGELVELNGIADPDLIHPGQELRLPGSSSGGSSGGGGGSSDSGGGGSSGSNQPGTRMLRLTSPMMRGPDVEFVQRWIGPRHAGAADGIFGPRTRDGVRWYQRMRGITVDGIVGPQTWSQMGVTWRG